MGFGRPALLLFLASAFLTNVHGGPRPPALIDIVFDLDWTLFAKIPKDSPIRDRRWVYEVQGEAYRLSDGVIESLNRLRAHPHVRLSVYSGGPASRNDALLKKIILDAETGLTAFDVMYRRLSFTDLEKLAPASNPSLPFTDRFRKNLAPFFPRLDRTVLVDDLYHFASHGQQGNLLWLGKTYAYFETYEDAQRALRSGSDPNYIPPNRTAWKLDRYRIPAVAHALEQAILADASSVEGSQTPFIQGAQIQYQRPRTELIEEWRRSGCRSILLPTQ